MNNAPVPVSVDIAVATRASVGFVRLDWHGGLSQSFDANLDVVASNPMMNIAALLGTSATVTVRGGRRIQYLNGVVHGVTQLHRRHGLTTYRLRLRPHIFALDTIRSLRSFQDQSVPNIAETILGEHSVPFVMRLNNGYAPRELVVQHNETDIGFLTRLFAENGIHWEFTHTFFDHKFVMFDTPSDSRRRLRFVGAPAVARGVTAWRPTVAGSVNGSVRSTLANSTAIAIPTTQTFALTDHPRTSENTDHQVKSIHLNIDAEGSDRPADKSQPARYSATLESTRAAEIVAASPSAISCAKAEYFGTVIGPAGESVFVDEVGRVKVDIESPDGTVAYLGFVPVAQPWAGDSHGTTFWPHVGDRVLVEFVDGDPSRPVVTGSLYRDGQVPAALPDAKQLTAINGEAGAVTLDASSPNAELTLDAARDLAITVGNDGQITIDADLVIEAGKEVKLSGGDAAITLKANGEIEIRGRTISLRADQSIHLQAPDVSGV